MSINEGSQTAPEKEDAKASHVGSARGSIFRRLLRVWGIERNTGRRLGFRLLKRFYVWAALGILLVVLSGFSIYSTSPEFCRSCHIMEPYYQAWAASKHKEVACVECHYPPGDTGTVLWKKFQALSQVAKFVTRTYSSKPYAEVEDAACLRGGCHSTRLLQGRVISEKGVLFDHRPHLEGVRYGRRLLCVSCHSQIVVGKHIDVTWDTCYLCHLKGRKQGRNIEPLGGCLGCHTLPDRRIRIGNIAYNHKEFLRGKAVACANCHQDVVQGDGEVDRDRCLTCHNQPEKLERIKEVAFLHDNHVTKHNTACFHCHREIRHGAAPAGTKSLALDCSLCHEDRHSSQRAFYMGLGVAGLEATPSPMYLANVDCVGCHLKARAHGDGRTYEGTEKGCVQCHGPEYDGILKRSHDLMRETVKKLEVKLEALRKSAPREAARELKENARDLAYVKRAHAIHNVYFAARILRRVEERLSALARTHRVDVERLTGLPVISGQYCATMCHGRVGVQVPPVKVKYKGKEMPHKDHSTEQGLGCVSCHEFGKHKEVSLKRSLPCKKCHEE